MPIIAIKNRDKLIICGLFLLNDPFKNLVSSFLIENYEEKLQVNEFLETKIETSFIKRVATGKAAENYFLQNFKRHFVNFDLLDVREFGCGSDFKLDLNHKQIYVRG